MNFKKFLGDSADFIGGAVSTVGGAVGGFLGGVGSFVFNIAKSLPLPKIKIQINPDVKQLFKELKEDGNNFKKAFNDVKSAFIDDTIGRQVEEDATLQNAFSNGILEISLSGSST